MNILVFLLLVVIFDAVVLLSLWLIGVGIDWWSLKPWLGATLLALLVAD